MKKSTRVGLLLGVGLPAALLALFVAYLTLSPPSEEYLRRQEARKTECAKALMSSMDHSIVAYADKAAYDAVVREKCQGFSINGIDLGK